ncbi:hypothetical protein SAMN04489760_10241 [Syntrophus gentianae]|uniref:HEPN domain-containing protein n=1 Tax=Syntrophus gentianae TaxID=43775 RepID=A0A1H7URJ4_9BACT|nr:hypothetical protein [Syntrophus gentianae]SEL99298.1 hypothetical protein SAMN04489760_10241 [Syntrophus gentianae]
MSDENEKLGLEPIFTPDVDWHCNACLNWTNDALELYVIGYKEAADKLVENIMETPRHQDALVFPICFLYRQYIELRLKELIKSGRRLLDEPAEFPQHHKILTLWETAEMILKKVSDGNIEPPDFLTLPSHVVKEFAKIDPDSFAFRYPNDKHGANPLEGLSHVNLRRVAQYVGAFASAMDAASTGISVYLDQKNEFMREYSGY